MSEELTVLDPGDAVDETPANGNGHVSGFTVDFERLLNATQSIDIPFMGHTIKLQVYTAGRNRLKREALAPLSETQKEGADGIDFAHALLPLVIESWTMDGEPMVWKGKLMPPTPENIKLLPAMLLIDMINAVTPIWANPTPAEPLPNGSAQEENVSEPMAIQ